MPTFFLPKSFKPFLVEHHPLFATINGKVQHALANTLYSALSNQQRHRIGDPDIFAVFWRSKQRAYGSAAAFDEANQQLDWFTLEVAAKVGSHTRGYRLTQKAREIGMLYFSASLMTDPESMDSSQRGLLDGEGRIFRTPSHAIRSKTSSGANTRFKKTALPSTIAIDGNRVQRFYEAALAWQGDAKCPEGWEWLYKVWDDITANPAKNLGRGIESKRVQRAATQALAILDLAKRYGADSYKLPSSYVESAQGRLYAEGPVTLQGCIRELRQAALEGCYDIDIENCHWTILSELAARQKVDTPHIRAYLLNKKAIREKLAADCEMCVDDAKFMLLALVYGASLTRSNAFHKSSIEKRISSYSFTNARSNAVVLNLHNDIKTASKAILASAVATTSKPGYIINEAGRQLKIAGSTAAEQLAHTVQGAESEILRICMESCDSIVVLQHDGFTCREKINTTDLAAFVREKTGHEVSFSITKL